MNTSRITVLLAASAALALTALRASADVAITTFTPGDLVVLRGGDANNPNTASTTNQVPVYLDEYTTAGTYVGTIAVDSSGANALTLPGAGDDQHQGVLSLSTNGQLLTFAGYNAAAGTPDANVTDPTIGKRIGIIGNSAASLDTTTVVNSYGAGSANPYIRGAVSNNGTSFWTFGKFAANGSTSNGGLAYVSGTGPSATTTTVEGFGDWRDIAISNSQLYGGTGSSSVGAHGPYQISTGEPTTNLGASLSSNTLLGSYPGGQSASALALLALPGDPNSQNGVNVMYTIGDQSTPGITKYYFDGTTWQDFTDVSLNANDVVDPTGLIVVQDPGNPNWVDITVSGNNGIYTYVDEGGYNTSIPDSVFTLAASAPAGEAFYGVALAPAVPEPASLGLLILGAGAMILRRRNK
jgi:hypothetical protein